jgi:subtilisin family serine protease
VKYNYWFILFVVFLVLTVASMVLRPTGNRGDPPRPAEAFPKSLSQLARNAPASLSVATRPPLLLKSSPGWSNAVILAEKHELQFGRGNLRVRVLSAPELHYPVRVEEIVEREGQPDEAVVSRVEMAAGHVLAKVKANVKTGDLLAALKDAGVSAVRPLGTEGLVKLELADATPQSVSRVLAALRAAPQWVDYAEPDYVVHTLLNDPNDPAYSGGELWGLRNVGQSGGINDADIDADEAWDVRTDASSVLVAVIDTGIRYSHEDLAANMWRNPGEVAGDGIDNDNNGVVDDVHGYNAINDSGNPDDDHFHGTHVAGTIGAVGNNGIGSAGVAWRARLMAVKFLSSNGRGFISDGVKAIDYARQNGARILNNSWGGGPYSQAVFDAIERCRLADVIFVAGAGNDGRSTDSAPFYPANYPHDNIVSVAAMTRTDELSSFSNHGLRTVDIAAPGSAIYSTYNTSDSAYRVLSGTSMATPHVVGALTLIKTHFPSAPSSELIDRLLATAQHTSTLTTRVRCQGRLNLARALTQQTIIALPSIDRHPSGTNVLAGASVTFSVSARGPGSLQYQWRRNGQNIPGATAPSLTLSAVQKADAGRFTVLVSNESGVALSEDAVLTVNEPVRITGQPQSIVAPQDATITFEVTATGDPPLSFQWRKDGSNLPNATNFAFTIYGVTVGDSGNYTVVVRNQVSTVVSASANLQVVAPPQVVVQPQNRTSMTGGSVTFTVNATGGVPLSYQWFRDGAIIGGASGTNLTLNNLNSGAVASYAVRVTNLAGQVWSQSAGLTLMNNATATNAPQITLHPTDQEVNAGGTVQFSAAATPNGVSYQWRRDGSNIPGANGTSLTLSNVSIAAGAVYSIVAMNSHGSASSRGARLTIRQPPVITQQPESVSSAAGSQVVLEIAAAGTAPLAYQWFKDGFAVAGATGRRLFIASLSAADTGTYTVRVTNLVGSITSTPATVSLATPTGLAQWRQLTPDQEMYILSCVGDAPDGIYIGSRDGTFSISADGGKTWTRRRAAVAPGARIDGVAYGGGRYVAIARDTNNTLFSLTSSDGMAWQRHSITLGWGFRLNPRYDGSAFYLLHGLYNFAFSEDGVSWTDAPIPQLGDGVIAVTHGAGRYVAVGLRTVYTSTDRVNWTAFPSQSEATLYDVAYGNGKFVAVGARGATSVSTNGTNWTLRPPVTSQVLFAVAFGNGRFVAVGGGQCLNCPMPAVTLVSNDGLTWRRTSNRATYNLADVAFVDGVFVAVGGNGQLLTSEDGETWTSRTPEENQTLLGIAHGNGTFVAVGIDGAILNSRDGQTWGAARQVESEDLRSIAYGAGQFVVGAADGGLYASSDGIVWQRQPTGAGVVTCVRYVNGRFFALTESGEVLVSPDAASWVRAPFVTGAPLWHIAWGGSMYAVVGHDGTILTSADGASWIRRATPAITNLYAIAWGAGRFVAVGEPGVVLRSTDGINWTSGSLGTNAAMVGLTYANGIFVAVGQGGLILTSADGQTWTIRPSGTQFPLYRVEFLNGRFVAAGGGIVHSVDGVTWTAVLGEARRDIAFGRGQYLSAGYFGKMYVSSDLAFWSVRTVDSLTSWALENVKFQGGQFVACTYNGNILTSSNGQDWSRRRTGFTSGLYGLAYGAGRHVAAGDSGAILYSSDTINWGTTYVPGVAIWDNLIYAGGQFIAVGFPPAIATSPDGINWTKRAVSTESEPEQIAYGNGFYLASTGKGEIVISTNGANWSLEAEIGNYTAGLVFSGGKFVISGAGGLMYSSVDGRNWTAHQRDNYVQLWRLMDYQGAIFGVSDSGVISVSAPLPNIFLQPLSQQLRAGSALNLTVAGASPGQLLYQWYKDGQLLPGESGPALNRQRAGPSDAGSYFARVSGLGGTVDSISARITVTQQPFDTWRITHFGEDDFVDPTKENSLWGLAADPDGDGHVNLAEYNYGSNPTVRETYSPLAPALVNGRLRVTFTRRTNDPALTLTPQVSGDLATWSQGSAFIREIAVIPLVPGFERVTIEDVAATEAQRMRFMRLLLQLAD